VRGAEDRSGASSAAHAEESNEKTHEHVDSGEACAHCDVQQQAIAKLERERGEYRKLYLKLLEDYKKLERGILGQKKAERMRSSDYQLALGLLGTLLAKDEIEQPEADADAQADAPDGEERKKKPRKPPTGRKPNPDHLPRISIEILPPEVERLGRDAFEQIGDDVSEVLEHRSASHVIVEIHRPKFVPKNRDRTAATHVEIAPPPDLPIERGKAGPGLLADTIVRRWQDHLPLYRLEGIYKREGIELARSTICAWHRSLADLVCPLVEAMHLDAFGCAYLCVDATGVLVRAPKECAHGHFWVLVAPEKHVLFFYSDRHDSEAIDDVLRGYRGKLVADAHSVYDHLFASGDCTECGCWSHARRYFYKALETDPKRAETALAWMRVLFKIEREIDEEPSARKRRTRQQQSKPIVETYLAWCDQQSEHVLDGTPISAAIRYTRNQRGALQEYLEDGRLPMTNNISERALRREAIGRKNWIFLGSPEAGTVNTTFVSLLASCAMHGIEPWGYLRDLFCLLPNWPARRVLELAPAYWNQTLEQADTQQRLSQNAFRRVALGQLREHSQTE